jgi:hypothetical protein
MRAWVESIDGLGMGARAYLRGGGARPVVLARRVWTGRSPPSRPSRKEKIKAISGGERVFKRSSVGLGLLGAGTISILLSVTDSSSIQV